MLRTIRQVFLEPENEDTEFDGSAVHLASTVYFGEAEGNEPSYNMWIEGPEDLQQRISEYKEDEFIRSLLDHRVAKITACVGYCG